MIKGSKSKVLNRKSAIWSVIFGALSLAMAGVYLVHPRVYYILYFVVLVIAFIRMCRSCNGEKYLPEEAYKEYIIELKEQKQYLSEFPEEKQRIYKKKREKSVTPVVIFIVLVVAVTFFLKPILDIYSSNHSRFEYSGEIANRKQRSEVWENRLEAFPERIPLTAKKVKWSCFDGFLQAAPFYRLSFYVDDAYIDQLIASCEKTANVYPYGTETYVGFDLYRPRVQGMEHYEGEYEFLNQMNDIMGKNEKIKTNAFDDLMVYEYGYSDESWSWCSGFYVSRENHFVCFYYEMKN